MSLKSSTVVVGVDPVLLSAGSPGTANVNKKVALVPDADILIGGIDAQTFPVSASGFTVDVVTGDDVWAVRAGVSDVNVSVLEVSV